MNLGKYVARHPWATGVIVSIGLHGLLFLGSIKKKRCIPLIEFSESVSLEDIAETGELIQTFPMEIPGASSVKKCIVPDSQYCLVHIRQSHLDKDTQEKDKERIKNTQGDIYNIISYLVDNDWVASVYDEGFFGYTSARAGANSPVLTFKHFDYDAVVRLNKEGKIARIGAEDYFAAVVADYALKLIKENNVKECGGMGVALYVIMDNREDVVLKIVSNRQKSGLAVCVYGGAHQWGERDSFKTEIRSSLKNNIGEWNKTHYRKFSLIEITPENYGK